MSTSIKRFNSSLSYSHLYLWSKSMIDHYIFADRKIKFWRQKNEELVGSFKKGSLIQIEDLGLDKKNLELFKEAQKSSNEVVIGDIDQDGFLLSNFGSIQNIPTVSKNQFYERKRFHLQLVAVHGFIGIKKNYKGNKIAFVNEIQGLYRLGKAGCNVPVLMNVDFDKLTLIYSYISGPVLRDELAKKEAVLQDRDVDNNPDFIGLTNEQIRLKCIQEGKRVLYDVIDKQFVEDFSTEIKKIHFSGVILNDIKYGNIIIEKNSRKPYLIDFERACFFKNHRSISFRILRSKDIKEFNLHFNTKERS